MDDTAQRAFLHGRFGDARVAVMRPGEWSTVYSVGTPNGELVARFSRFDEDFEKDAYAARYASAALPIPRILEWGPAPDGFYAVAERVAGEHIDGLDGARMRRALPALFAALDAMRAVDLSGRSGFGGWRAADPATHPTWQDWLLSVATGPATRGARGWRDLLAGSPVGTRPFEDGLARMRELVDLCPEARHLIHDDLINRNLLVEGDRITAVLDWGSSVYGDFLYDVAKLVFYQPWYPAWRDIDFAAEARAHYDRIGLAVPHLAERLTCYGLRIGIADMAYSAFRGRWDEVARKAERLLEVAPRRRESG